MSEVPTWRLDPAHTSAEFAVRHLMISTVRGRFTDVQGLARLDPASPTGASLEATIGVPSLGTGNPDRDAHLRSPDFFDAERFPTITFRSRRVEQVPSGGLQVIGELTMRGVTREVALNASLEGRGRDPWGGERVGYRAETKLNRKDFGLTWNQALETGGVVVSDEVKVTLDVELVREAIEVAA